MPVKVPARGTRVINKVVLLDTCTCRYGTLLLQLGKTWKIFVLVHLGKLTHVLFHQLKHYSSVVLCVTDIHV